MVEYNFAIDAVFTALSDGTRRDILERTSQAALTVNQIALEYDMSVAAVSKHLKVLDDAGLITRRKEGRFVYVATVPSAFKEASDYMSQFAIEEINVNNF